MYLFIILIVVIGLIFLILITISRKKKGLSNKDLELISQKWKKIYNLKGAHAIIEADKLLDYILTKKGFSGTTAEKIRQAEGMFSDVEAVWSVHKLRNRIAHEININLDKRRIEQTLLYFKKAIQDLGGL